MEETTQLPHVCISTSELGKWVESQNESWWYVDGDPLLMSKLDFSCPSDELAAELKQHESTIMVFDGNEGSTANGEQIDADDFGQLANTENNSGARNFLLAWDHKDKDVLQWLLVEDLKAVSDARGSGETPAN